ncbi:MAG: TlpA disulfide reductase family protein, partial [Thermoplasmata archaeon]
MPLWSDALKQGFRLVPRARLLLLVPLAFDLAMIAIVLIPPVTSPQFTMPVALPSVAQVHGPGGGALPFYPLYMLAPSGDLATALLLLVLVVQSYLAAGYVGRLEMVRRKASVGGFFASANRAFARVLAFLAITTFLVLAASPFLLGGLARGPAALFVFAPFSTAQAPTREDVRPVDAPEIKELVGEQRGHVVLLNFWATWCPPCLVEFPEIVDLEKSYRDRGLIVLSVSADIPAAIDSKLLPFLEKHGPGFPIYLMQTDDVDEFIGIIDPEWNGAIPATFFIDRHGNVADKRFSAMSR